MLLIFIALFALIFLENVVIIVAGIQQVAPDNFALPLITVHAIIFLFYLYTRGNRDIGAILALALLLRIGLMFCDYYHLFPILNSGSDTEAFHRYAMRRLMYPDDQHPYSYPDFVYRMYCITYASRLTVQYINVIFGTGILVMVWKTLSILRVDNRTMRILLIVLALMPNLVIFSGILLREAWVEFFVAVSAFYFVKWFKHAGIANVIGTIAALLAASRMHAGVIGIAIGYTIAFIVYNPNTRKVTFSTTSVLSIVAMTAIYLLIADSFELFTGKFNAFSFEDNTDFMEKVNRVGGGDSDYLTWINADSTAQGLLFSPLKMFYFLFSPLPTDWRRVSDVAGFAIDGAIYMWMCWALWRYRAGGHTILKRFLVTAMLCAVFIFGYGTFNAGTAFRHRAKLISLIAIPFALSYSNRRNPSGENLDDNGNLINNPFNI